MPSPSLTPSDANVVLTHRGGVCHTDPTTKSALPDGVPFVLGHEGAGIVMEVGSAVAGVTIGDHVVVSYRHCGACDRCRDGRVAYCARFVELNARGVRSDGSHTLSQDGSPVMASFFGQSSFLISYSDNTVVG